MYIEQKAVLQKEDMEKPTVVTTPPSLSSLPEVRSVKV